MAGRKNDDDDDGAGAAIFAFFALLLAGAGVAYGIDQKQKREREAARFHQELEGLRTALAQKEAEFADLAERLGPKNEQVWVLAAEVERLRAEVAERERAA